MIFNLCQQCSNQITQKLFSIIRDCLFWSYSVFPSVVKVVMLPSTNLIAQEIGTVCSIFWISLAAQFFRRNLGSLLNIFSADRRTMKSVDICIGWIGFVRSENECCSVVLVHIFFSGKVQTEGFSSSLIPSFYPLTQGPIGESAN